MNRPSSERLLRGAFLTVAVALPAIAVAQPAANRRAPAAPTTFPAQPADRARIVVLHLAATEGARPLSVWSSSAGLAPWVADVGYAHWSHADVAPGSQGYAARAAGMEPPTAARLGSNTGAGNLLAGRSYFLVMAQPATQERANTRIEAASTVAPTGGASALRVMGAWPVNRTIDVCVSGDGGARPVVAGLGGRGYFGAAAPGSQALPAGEVQLTLHLQQGTPCAGPALGHLRVELAAGQGYALFLHGEAETSLAGVLCRESGAGCQRAAVNR